MEIEKKYLINNSEYYRIVAHPKRVARINQYYLNNINDKWLIRIRSIENIEPITNYEEGYYLTLKTLGLEAREELEYNITREEFLTTMLLAKTHLRKIRFWVNIDGVNYEIDKYDNHEFITCEIEFKSMEEYNNFVKPEWCVEDVTNDINYKNVNLTKPL